MSGDLSDHVAGANGVSNGVDQSLPALKHEHAGRLSPSPPRANAYSNNEPSIIVGIIIIAGSARSSFFSCRPAGFSSFVSTLSGADLYGDLMSLKLRLSCRYKE